ncbi:MAG: sensor histidine kinase [Acidimicrobiales bacterium]
MVRNVVRSLWAEPRPANPPRRVWRDWALVLVVVVWSATEALLRDGLAPGLLVLVAAVAVTAPLLWRRTHPLAAVGVSFAMLAAVDLTRVLTDEGGGLLTSVAVALVLAYSLFRWGSGREAVIGLGPILVWLVITNIADPTTASEAAGAYGFFLFAAALGAAVRYLAMTRVRDIDEAKTREREQLARELHDTVAHHVSGIAIQAQAGRAVATAHPERAVDALATIEDAAARTLTERRPMVGVLRASDAGAFAPRPGVADIERLAGQAEGRPHVDVDLSGELDELSPAVGAAIYRLAQESITNAGRHARHATRVTVRVVGNAERVQLTVDDDGDPSTTGGNPSGFGLVGMRERATLLGGTFHAGPTARGGWRVEAMLPRAGTAR